MAISQSKYVNIISSLGGGSSVNQRELIGRVFSQSTLIPAHTVIEFGGGATQGLASVGEYFGFTSAEYNFAKKYFSFSTSANTQPQKISFYRRQAVAQNSMLIGKPDVLLANLQAITDGTLNITIDNSLEEITGINLSSATSLSEVATLITTKLGSVVVQGDTPCVCYYDSSWKRFWISGDNYIFNDYATGTVAEVMGWIASEGIISEPAEVETPLETVSGSAEISNNFFSFCFLDTLTTDEITAVAEWTDAQNVKYMFSVSVTESNYSTIQTAVKDYDGVALTLDIHNAHAEFMPMSAFASVDYKNPNSIMDIFYKQFDGVLPSVTTNAKRLVYDPLRINYYGMTQQAGQQISFYQDGVLQGSIPSMTVYANEAWLKDSFITDVLNLRMGLDSLPANTTGKSLVMSALMNTVNQALINGVVLAGKELDATQKAYITTITGDNDGWIAVQNAGYRLSAEIEKYTENNMEKYKVSFLFVYSKGDTINYVDGKNILI